MENGQQNSILKTRYLGKYTWKRPRNEWKSWWCAAVHSQKVTTKGMTGEKKPTFPKTRPQDGRTQQETIPDKNEHVGGGLPADVQPPRRPPGNIQGSLVHGYHTAQ